MTEYIERDNWIVKPTVTEAIENLSTENEVRYRGTVTVSMQEYRPVVHGHWIVDRMCGNDVLSGEHMVICSICDKGVFFGKTNYCPNCGAKMEVEDG